MAHTGGIDYLDVGYGVYAWEDIESPWPQDATTEPAGADVVNMALVASARDYDLGAATFDNPLQMLPRRSLCVVLGKARGKASANEQRHCVLIVAPVVSKGGNTVYERIGTGFLPAKCISPGMQTVRIY
jgi:hypothetical protein